MSARRAAWAVVLGACGRIGFDQVEDVDATVDAFAPPVSLVGATSGPHHAPGATESVMRPSSVVAGDLLLLAFYADLKTAAVTSPPGWQVRLQYTDVGHQYQASFFMLRAGASEPSSYTFPISGSDQIGWALAAYRGVSSSIPIDRDEALEQTAAVMATQVTFTAPSLATTHSGDELVLLVVDDAGNSGTWTPPVGATSRTPVSEFRTAIFDRALVAAGDTGDEITSLSVPGTSSPSGAIWLVALAR